MNSSSSNSLLQDLAEKYREINSTTLTGSIDVLVVKQEDGSLLSTPFHVRFGKLGVLKAKEKVVNIEVNKNHVDVQMRLDKKGIAYFLEEVEDLDSPASMDVQELPSVLQQQYQQQQQQQMGSHAMYFSKHSTSISYVPNGQSYLSSSSNGSSSLPYGLSAANDPYVSFVPSVSFHPNVQSGPWICPPTRPNRKHESSGIIPTGQRRLSFPPLNEASTSHTNLGEQTSGPWRVPPKPCISRRSSEPIGPDMTLEQGSNQDRTNRQNSVEYGNWEWGRLLSPALSVTSSEGDAADCSVKTDRRYRKTLRLSPDVLQKLELKEGRNEAVFIVKTAYQGTTKCKCRIYLWSYNDVMVISDIDGTITKSDVQGQVLPIIGRDCTQVGVAKLFSRIAKNGYRLAYLSARAIGQSGLTKSYLASVNQEECNLPDGPIFLNPTSLVGAFHREVIQRNPEEFKIACMRDIQSLFSKERNPLYAGYGNRPNDVTAYRTVGIHPSRIFTVNSKGELWSQESQCRAVQIISPTKSYSGPDPSSVASYTSQCEDVDSIYPSLAPSGHEVTPYSSLEAKAKLTASSVALTVYSTSEKLVKKAMKHERLKQLVPEIKTVCSEKLKGTKAETLLRNTTERIEVECRKRTRDILKTGSSKNN